MRQMNIDIFLNQILLESIDCLFEFTQIIMPLLKDLMPDKYYLEKSIIKNYNIIINGKNFYDQESVLISNDTKKLKN